MDPSDRLNCSAAGDGLPANATCSLAAASIPFLVLEFAKVLYAIVCVVGLLGNSLVIYVVLRFSKMQTVTNMYILNLALADEMFLVGLPFLIVTLVFKEWVFGSLICKVYMTTTSINQFTSSLLLTVMSADRFVAVVHPVSLALSVSCTRLPPCLSPLLSSLLVTAQPLSRRPVFLHELRACFYARTLNMFSRFDTLVLRPLGWWLSPRDSKPLA